MAENKLDLYPTPFDAYEATKARFRESMNLFRDRVKKDILEGRRMPWTRQGKKLVTFWLDGVTPVRIGGRRG